MTRIIISFLSFVCLLSAIVASYVIYTSKSPKINRLISSLAPKEESIVFYNSIGTLPNSLVKQSQTAAHAKGDRYTLELEVTTNQTKADKVLDEYQARGLEAYYTPVQKGAQVYYHVRQGIFQNKKAATIAASELLSKRNIHSKVIVLN